MKNKSQKKEKAKIDTKKLIPIIVAAMLALIVLFGAVLGIIALVREVNAVVSYNGVTLTEGVTAYLASTFKQSYLLHLNREGYDAMDTEVFWESEDMDGVVFGDSLYRECETYIRNITAAAYLFDLYGSLSSEAKEEINKGVAEVLDYKADGSVKKFNEMSKDMGFTYSDFVAASEIVYKAEHAAEVIYGADGSLVASDVGFCEQYLAEYAHVRLLYIRHNDAFVLDEDGNRIVEDGRDKLEALSSDQKAKRQADIAALIEAIDNIALGLDGQMSEIYFNSQYETYNDDPDNAAGGYYFSANSAYALGFAEMYYDVVKSALDMKVGGFDYVDVDEDGDDIVDLTVFIYRFDPTPYAYASSAYAHFFEDFYINAASYHFDKLLEELTPSVNIKESYSNVDVLSLSPNGTFYIS